VGDALKVDLAAAAALLEDILKSSANPANAAVDDVLAAGTNGLSARYYSTPDAVEPPFATGVDPQIDFDGTKNPLPPNTASVRWDGQLLVPGKDPLTFFVRATGTVRLWVGDMLQPVLEGTAEELASQPLKLKPNQFSQIRLEVTQLATPGTVKLSWQSASMPKEIVPAESFCPAAVIDSFTLTFTRLGKAAMLTNGFGLSPDELVYITGHSTDFGNLDLNALPVDRNDAATADQAAPAAFKWWRRLAAYKALRDTLPRGQVRLIDLFSAASLADQLLSLPASPEDDQRKQLALTLTKQFLLGVTNWDFELSDSLTGVATFDLKKQTEPPPPPPPPPPQDFNLTVAAFKNDQVLARLVECAALIRRVGVSGQKLFAWGKALLDGNTDAKFDALFVIAQDIKKTVKAKFDEETWLDIAKPLADRLRTAQKSALIAYVLTLPDLVAAGVKTPDQLYEYFLIDVQMDACMQTSRIKQAISTVQLFVQRCLINLEDFGAASLLTVQPQQIDTVVWQWKKHYRVWEANRKVFLYPENFLEPELRDDKTLLFKDLESELLQSDLSNDSAETALMHYLEGLNQVANLEICGMYWENRYAEPTDAGDILHVFARTGPGKPHLYYYRQLINGKEWTAWERVQADIPSVEKDRIDYGIALLPVVWNRKLYLFWPEITLTTLSTINASNILDIKLAWSTCKEGTWASKQYAPQSLSANDLFIPFHAFRSSMNSDGKLALNDFFYFDQSNPSFGPVQLGLAQFMMTGCSGQVIVNNSTQPVRQFPEQSQIWLAPDNTLADFEHFHSLPLVTSCVPGSQQPVFHPSRDCGISTNCISQPDHPIYQRAIQLYDYR
jgi:hypothetical protein